ncbi:MAG TPA: NUDIX domain-containing protein [Gemmatimonadaceae bacterium]|nr:NUDIX domain-containing protein [Gemmatimonadaceae bacterium]
MSDITAVRVGVVDVFVLRRRDREWDALVLERAAGVRCPGAWETVHGRIEPGERPEDAAVREVREETGLVVDRLYNVTVQPFYLHQESAVMVAVVFAAIVRDAPLTLGPEHARADWMPIADAERRFAWPRERANVRDAAELLRDGDAGKVEDVLRVK